MAKQQQINEAPAKKVRYITPNPGGARCPRCGNHAPVTSAPVMDGRARMRCHHCIECDYAFQSVEEL